MRNPLFYIDPDGNQVKSVYMIGGDNSNEKSETGESKEINESNKISSERKNSRMLQKDATRHLESGATNTDVGLLDPVDWMSGSIATASMRAYSRMTLSVTEKLVERSIKSMKLTENVFLNETALNWSLENHKTVSKWASQMNERGWTSNSITEAIMYGQKFTAVNKIKIGNAATRYVHPETGQSVVVDNITKEIIQVGGKNFDY